MKVCINKSCIAYKNLRRDTDIYCEDCGMELKPATKCSCGEELRAYSKYCPKCGKEIPQ